MEILKHFKLEILCVKIQKLSKYYGVGASSGTVPVWFDIWPCEKAPRNWNKGSEPTSRKITVLKFPQMASCPSDVNKM
jgi:hypothetical protein